MVADDVERVVPVALVFVMVLIDVWDDAVVTLEELVAVDFEVLVEDTVLDIDVCVLVDETDVIVSVERVVELVLEDAVLLVLLVEALPCVVGAREVCVVVDVVDLVVVVIEVPETVLDRELVELDDLLVLEL